MDVGQRSMRIEEVDGLDIFTGDEYIILKH